MSITRLESKFIRFRFTKLSFIEFSFKISNREMVNAKISSEYYYALDHYIKHFMASKTTLSTDGKEDPW